MEFYTKKTVRFQKKKYLSTLLRVLSIPFTACLPYIWLNVRTHSELYRYVNAQDILIKIGLHPDI